MGETEVKDKVVSVESLKVAYDSLMEHISSVAIDDEMSDVSENAVQNKVIKAYIDGLLGEITEREY